MRSSPIVNEPRPLTTTYASWWPVSDSSWAMSNSSPGSQTIAFMPNACRPSGPFSCCQRPKLVGLTGSVLRSTVAIVSPSVVWSGLGAADDHRAADGQPLGAKVADAGLVPPAQHLVERMVVPEALDAGAQEAAGAIPAGAARGAHDRQADPRPGPPGRVP